MTSPAHPRRFLSPPPPQPSSSASLQAFTGLFPPVSDFPHYEIICSARCELTHDKPFIDRPAAESSVCVFQDATKQSAGETSWWCSMGPAQPAVLVSLFLAYVHTHTLIMLLHLIQQGIKHPCRPPTHLSFDRSAGIEYHWQITDRTPVLAATV